MSGRTRGSLNIATAVLCLTSGAFAIWAAEPTAQQKEQIRKIESSLLAPCCYSESLVTHNSEIAVKMRSEIAAWVAEGKTEREILEAYKKLYGLRVLAEPEGATWWWSVLVPWIVLAIGAVGAVMLIARWVHTPRPTRAGAPVAGAGILPDIDDDWY